MSDALFNLLKSLFHLDYPLMNLIRCELINPLVGFVDHGTHVLISLAIRDSSSAIRVSASSLTTAFLRVKNLEHLEMKIPVSVLPVDDLGFHGTLEDLRIIIVDIIPKVLHVLLWIVLVLSISEHVADLFQMIR